MGELDGKRIVVSGASRGLGRAFADALAGAGANVVVNGTNEALLIQLQLTPAEFDEVVDNAARQAAGGGREPPSAESLGDAGESVHRPQLAAHTADQRVTQEAG